MAQNKFRWNLILACSNNQRTVAINSTKSYRDDSSAKPPSSSLTLQNKTPFTKGTDDSSSKSKFTLNLNLFFFIRMNDMMRPPGSQQALTEADRQPDTFPARRCPCCSLSCCSLLLLLVGFKVQISSFTPTEKYHSWREGHSAVWLDPAAARKKEECRGHDCSGRTLAETHSKRPLWEEILFNASQHKLQGVNALRWHCSRGHKWHV